MCDDWKDIALDFRIPHIADENENVEGSAGVGRGKVRYVCGNDDGER
jgi:hypothetical protein